MEDILESKVNEFHLLGYDKATKQSIWTCLEAGIWKENPELYVSRVVGDIFELKPNTYMNHLTFQTYGDNDDLLKSIEALTKN